MLRLMPLGDLNGDFRNDHADFVTFKAAFDAANGSGAFLAMLQSVPEPSALVLLANGWIAFGYVPATRFFAALSMTTRLRFGAEHRIGEHFGDIANLDARLSGGEAVAKHD